MVGRVRGFRATAAGAACLVVIAFGLSGCTPEEEPTPSETTTGVTEEPSTETASPTPTPTPTETPTLTPEEVNVEAAKQTVIEYHRLVDEVASEGYSTWTDKLIGYWGAPAVSNLYSVSFQASADQGRRGEGSTEISSIVVLEYLGSGTADSLDRIKVEYCADYASTATYDNAGNQLAPSGLNSFVWGATLQKQVDGRWSYVELTPYNDRPC